VNADEVHVVKVDGYSIGMIVQFLRESVSQSGETAHVHPHRQILALYVRSRNVLWVWVSAYFFRLTADANGGRISRFIFQRVTVNLLQLRVIDIRAECFFDCGEISLMTVCCDLHAPLNPAGSILHKIHRPVRATSTDKIRNY
jgi:hypothetical protein